MSARRDRENFLRGNCLSDAFVNTPHYCAGTWSVPPSYLPPSGSRFPAASFVTSHVRRRQRRRRRRLVQRHRKWQQSTKQFNKCRNHVKVLSKTFCSNDHVGGPGEAPNDTLPYTRSKCDTTRSPKLKFKSTHAQLSKLAEVSGPRRLSTAR